MTTAPSDPRRSQLAVALHDIRSLHNVGAVFRTASGAGFDHVYLSGFTGSPPDPRIAKVALGAEAEVSFSQTTEIDELVELTRDHHVVALEQTANSIPYYDFRPPNHRPVTLLLGGELQGLPQALTDQAGSLIEIPMLGEKESLNVSVAFGIVAYHLALELGRLKTALPSNKRLKPVREGVLTKGQTTGELPGTR